MMARQKEHCKGDDEDDNDDNDDDDNCSPLVCAHQATVPLVDFAMSVRI